MRTTATTRTDDDRDHDRDSTTTMTTTTARDHGDHDHDDHDDDGLFSAVLEHASRHPAVRSRVPCAALRQETSASFGQCGAQAVNAHITAQNCSGVYYTWLTLHVLN